MEQTHALVSQVLVHEHDATALQQIKDFCAANNLVGLKVHADNFIDVLKSNLHLGAILLSESPAAGADRGVDLAIELHRLRPELPIFLRRGQSSSLDDLPPPAQGAIAGVYQIGSIGKLKELVDSYLFSAYYPSEFVRGIAELTVDSLHAAFRGVDVHAPVPYIVRDKLIYGELFSLMPLESSWCRGYMMFQVEERNMLDMIRMRKTQLAPKEPNFRDVNNLLSEIANMVWGGFKARFFAQDDGDATRPRTHVPIIINHGQRFISFGTDYPQLCFQYRITDKSGGLAPITLYQKFVFSLHWAPEKFAENQRVVDDLIDRGELELF